MGLSAYLHLTCLNQLIITMLTDWALYDKRLYWQEQFKFAKWTPVHESSGCPSEGTLYPPTSCCIAW